MELSLILLTKFTVIHTNFYCTSTMGPVFHWQQKLRLRYYAVFTAVFSDPINNYSVRHSVRLRICWLTASASLGWAHTYFGSEFKGMDLGNVYFSLWGNYVKILHTTLVILFTRWVGGGWEAICQRKLKLSIFHTKQFPPKSNVPIVCFWSWWIWKLRNHHPFLYFPLL